LLKTLRNKMKHYLFAIFLLMSITFLANSQQNNYSFQQQYIFSNYLIQQFEYDEALFVISKTSVLNRSQQDSLNYLKGWALYNNKQLKKSAECFADVSKFSILYTKSMFFAAYNNFHNGDVLTGDSILSSLIITADDELSVSLKNFEMAGSALLKRDIELFDKYSNSFRQQYYQFAKEEEQLIELRNTLEKFNPKSPLVAGLLSTFVPGLGKIYSGHIGGGVSAFLIVTALGAVTYENFNKGGTQNPKTWIYGGAFAIAYSANIFGSVYSVKAYRNEFKHQISQTVLFNMHIPLRNCFN